MRMQVGGCREKPDSVREKSLLVSYYSCNENNKLAWCQLKVYTGRTLHCSGVFKEMAEAVGGVSWKSLCPSPCLLTPVRMQLGCWCYSCLCATTRKRSREPHRLQFWNSWVAESMLNTACFWTHCFRKVPVGMLGSIRWTSCVDRWMDISGALEIHGHILRGDGSCGGGLMTQEEIDDR